MNQHIVMQQYQQFLAQKNAEQQQQASQKRERSPDVNDDYEHKRQKQ